MKTSLILGYLFLAVLSSCSSFESSNNTNEFIFPSIEITQNGKAINENILETINVDSLREQYSGYVIGRYSIDDINIKLTELNPDKTPEYYSDVNLDTLQSDGLQIKLDTSQLVVDPWYYYLLDKKISFHPVVLLNETTSPKAITTINSRVLLLQEIYYDNNWVAINSPEIFNMCGDSNSNIVLGSNEYLLLNAPVYTGKDSVKMRIRLGVGDNIYVSKPYQSRVNLSQVFLTDFAKENKTRYMRKGNMGESYWEKLPYFK